MDEQIAPDTPDGDNLYRSGRYLELHPSLHTQDSDWKVTKITPLIDRCLQNLGAKPVVLLDVGGGAGLVLHSVADHITTHHGVDVTKYALDLSQDMLDVQKTHNPGIVKLLNEDICQTSLDDGEVDIAMLIDVLEHIPNPQRALQEAARIAKYVILKLPLEENYFCQVYDILKGGWLRKRAIERVGHVNFYTARTLKREVRTHGGEIVSFAYTNVFSYPGANTKGGSVHPFARRCKQGVGILLHSLSPALAARVMGDYAMVLYKSPRAPA